MALQISTSTPSGFITDVAYARITNFSGDKNSVNCIVAVHKDMNAKEQNLQPISCELYQLDIPFGASMQQMYDALKLLPEFTGAIDV